MQSWQRKVWFVYLEIIWRWWRHNLRQQLCRRDRQQLSVKSWPLSSVIAKIESGLRNSIANLFSPAGNCLQSPLETEDDLLLFCKVSSDAFFCWNNIVNNCCCHGNGYEGKLRLPNFLVSRRRHCSLRTKTVTFVAFPELAGSPFSFLW